MFVIILYFGLLFGDRELTAAVLILEAGGETDTRAMYAVMEVIRNRCINKNKDILSTILKDRQFSCLNNLSPQKAINIAKQHPKWNLAVEITWKKSTNFTFGADHYYHTNLKPVWRLKMKKTARIGNHVFYRSTKKKKKNS